MAVPEELSLDASLDEDDSFFFSTGATFFDCIFFASSSLEDSDELELLDFALCLPP